MGSKDSIRLVRLTKNGQRAIRCKKKITFIKIRSETKMSSFKFWSSKRKVKKMNNN